MQRNKRLQPLVRAPSRAFAAGIDARAKPGHAGETARKVRRGMDRGIRELTDSDASETVASPLSSQSRTWLLVGLAITLDFDLLRNLVATHYSRERTVNGVVIYRRHPAS